MSCINSLRIRAYSVDERSTASQLSSGGDWLSVATEMDELEVSRLLVPPIPGKLKFMDTNEKG